MLETLRQIDASYRTSVIADTVRHGNTDIMLAGTSNRQTTRICNVIEMNRHSMLAPDGQRSNFPHEFPRQVVAAVALAMEHLNTGNGSIVSAINGLNETCNIRFVPEFLDTAGISKQAVSSLIQIVDRHTFRPCAFIGAFPSEVSISTAIITGAEGFPQITAVSNYPQLADKGRFPLVGSVITKADEHAGPLLEWIYQKWNVRHLAVLYEISDVGLAYLDGLHKSASAFPGLRLDIVGFQEIMVEEEIESKIKVLKDMEIRFFFLICRGERVELILREAYKQGIAGTGEHNWITSDEGQSLLSREFETTDPMFKAMTGLVSYKLIASQHGIGQYDAFLAAWTAVGNNADDVAFLEEKLPHYPNATSYITTIDETVFLALHPYVALLYDATVLLGLSACSVQAAVLEGTLHFQQILNTTFVGAAGPLALNATTACRTTSDSLFGLRNFVPEQQPSGNFTFSNRELAVYQEGGWHELLSATFNDNTSEIPSDLPPLIVENNHIGPKLRWFGYIQFGVVLLTSLAMAVWTFWNKKSRVIRASQPFFLYFICIVLLTIGWCFAVSALLSKTIVVNAIFRKPEFQRVVLKRSDILKPMLLVVMANVVVLLIWAAISPYRWERYDVQSDKFARPIETTGRCESEHGTAFWTVCLLFHLGILSFASHQAFMARKIAIEFAESEHISMAISTALIALFVASPVIRMVGDQPRAFFFVRSAFVFVVSMALLMFIFLPKIIHSRHNGSPDIEPAVKTTLDRMQNRSTSHYRRPGERSDRSLEDDDQVGARVVDHPMLRKEKENELARLIERNAILEMHFAEHETGSNPELAASTVLPNERNSYRQDSWNAEDSQDDIDVRAAVAIGETYLKSAMRNSWLQKEPKIRIR